MVIRVIQIRPRSEIAACNSIVVPFPSWDNNIIQIHLLFEPVVSEFAFVIETQRFECRPDYCPTRNVAFVLFEPGVEGTGVVVFV